VERVVNAAETDPARGRGGLTLAAKLLAGAVIGATLVALVGGVGWFGSRSVDNDAERIRASGELLRTVMEGDMMHDALYGDAYSALQASSQAEHQAVRDRLAEHQSTMREAILDHPGLNAEPSLTSAMASVRPDLEAYLDSASELVDLAIKDRAAAMRRLPGFLDAYETLEGRLATLDDQVEKLADDAAAGARETNKRVATTVLLITVVATVLLLGLNGAIIRQVRRGLAQLSEALGQLAARDLTVRLPVGRDELGVMAGRLNQAAGELGDALARISDSSNRLDDASRELGGVAGALEQNAVETSSQAGAVSAGATQVTANIETVSSGAEQMSASITEIARSAGEAANVATRAVELASTSSDAIAKLGESSNEIAGVIKVITSIAEQTNLLALNATIEAARAGEAGKGFAVVAGEVKELAQETAKATEDISRRIEAIQTDSGAAISAVDRIGSVIGEIDQSQTTIAGAVEQQAATTAEIGRSVSEAAAGSNEIARNISGVASAAESTTRGATGTRAAADDLARMAGELRDLVGHFRY
jgi:methyl-accepting chemotaxis protein